MFDVIIYVKKWPVSINKITFFNFKITTSRIKQTFRQFQLSFLII